MITKVGAKDPLALLPGGGARRLGVKASGVVQLLLLFTLVVVVVIGLVCDATQYYGVDIQGRPIYPEKEEGPPWELGQTWESP